VPGDPVIERIRDAFGAVRCLYAAAPDAQSQHVLKHAGSELAGALSVAESKRREGDLLGRLRGARKALDDAMRAAPWAARALAGVLRRMPPAGRAPWVACDPAPGPRRRPLPPFYEDEK
jgi:hypothetical protein